MLFHGVLTERVYKVAYGCNYPRLRVIFVEELDGADGGEGSAEEELGGCCDRKGATKSSCCSLSLY
jgi:hypothetical protein